MTALTAAEAHADRVLGLIFVVALLAGIALTWCWDRWSRSRARRDWWNAPHWRQSTQQGENHE